MTAILIIAYGWALATGTIYMLRHVYAWKRQRLQQRIKALEAATLDAPEPVNPYYQMVRHEQPASFVMSTWQPLIHRIGPPRAPGLETARQIARNEWLDQQPAHNTVGIAQIAQEDEVG